LQQQFDEEKKKGWRRGISDLLLGTLDPFVLGMK